MTRALGMTDAQDAKQAGCEGCVETMGATVLAAAGLTACACSFRYFDERGFQHWSTKTQGCGLRKITMKSWMPSI